MKTLRAAFLVLLALLLPLRGAVAGALDCPQGGAPGVATAAHADHTMHAELHNGPHAMHALNSQDGATHHDHADVQAAAEPGHGTGCHLCASACSLTPMPLGAMPALAPSALLGSLRYPPLAAPAPIFESDTQDRPPRTS
jgi:hypothetical protein